MGVELTNPTRVVPDGDDPVSRPLEVDGADRCGGGAVEVPVDVTIRPSAIPRGQRHTSAFSAVK
jgi:hypothetical protein